MKCQFEVIFKTIKRKPLNIQERFCVYILYIYIIEIIEPIVLWNRNLNNILYALIKWTSKRKRWKNIHRNIFVWRGFDVAYEYKLDPCLKICCIRLMIRLTSMKYGNRYVKFFLWRRSLSPCCVSHIVLHNSFSCDA